MPQLTSFALHQIRIFMTAPVKTIHHHRRRHHHYHHHHHRRHHHHYHHRRRRRLSRTSQNTVD